MTIPITAEDRLSKLRDEIEDKAAELEDEAKCLAEEADSVGDYFSAKNRRLRDEALNSAKNRVTREQQAEIDDYYSARHRQLTCEAQAAAAKAEGFRESLVLVDEQLWRAERDMSL